MIRRGLFFLCAVLLVGGVASLVYFNSQPTTLRWGPRQELTLPLAWLILGSTLAGAFLGLAALAAREGRWALRLWKMTRALRASERAAARRSEARASTLAGRHARARALLEKTAVGPGAIVDDSVDYGLSFLAEGRAADGRAHLEAARRELGDDPGILHALARCCRAAGDHAAAVAALDKAVAALPASVVLHQLLRDCLVELEWWPRAEAAQQRLVELLPGDRSEKARLVELRMHAASSGDTAEKESALRAVLALDPGYPAAAAERARMLAAQGHRWSSVRVLAKALRRRPARETLEALDDVLADQPRRALRLYGRLLRARPGHRELVLHQAAWLARQGRRDDARSALAALGGETGREGEAVDLLASRPLAAARAEAEAMLGLSVEG